MKLKCLASGSSGNCYLLEDNNGEKLLLDLGISESNIKVGLGFEIMNVVGALVSHTHSDHSKSVSKVEKWGVPVAKPYESDKDRQKYKFGLFNVISFALKDKDNEHWCHSNADGSECPVYGFLIKHEEIGSLLYITDTRYCKYTFPGINHILVGVNYDADVIEKDNPKYQHCLTGHMSVNEMENMLKANDNGYSLKNVILCHISTENGLVKDFIDRAKKCVNNDCRVDVASKGKEWEI